MKINKYLEVYMGDMQIGKSRAKLIAEEIQETVCEHLGKYLWSK